MPNNENPLVTIAIPTFNRANGFLKQALQSAISQTYGHLEIIVSDNCSTDHTEQLVTGYNDNRIRYIKHPRNIGAANNFNCCVHQAKGDYFLLLHDDDLIDPDFIEACVSELKGNYTIGAVFTGIRVIDEDGNILNETPNRCHGLSAEDFFIKWFEGKVGLYLCNALYQTEKLKEIGGFKSKTSLLQDAVADIKLAWNHGRADVLDIKASFRRHTGNRGGDPASINAWCEDSFYVYGLLCKLPVDDQKTFREKALKYFAKKNYKLAGTIDSWPKRIKAYHRISRTYNFEYPAYRYFSDLKIRPKFSQLRKRLKRA